MLVIRDDGTKWPEGWWEVSGEVPEYRKSNFTVALISEDGGFRMETSGEFSVFDQLGIVEAARALLRLQVLNARKVTKKPRRTTAQNRKGGSDK